MSSPLIGVTGYSPNEKMQYTLPKAYIQSLRLVGCVPVMIAPGEKRLKELYDRLDGLVFSGGGDIHPQHYQGDASHKAIYGVCEERDEFEMQLLKIALEGKKPILAICRGMQLTNIALGGTLVEHLPDDFGEDVVHRHSENKHVFHEVEVVKTSRLIHATENGKMHSASWHHQALKKLGSGVVPVAFSKDGIVEAVEVEPHPWCLGVQWHPEISAHEDKFQKQLFIDFAKRAGEHCS